MDANYTPPNAAVDDPPRTPARLWRQMLAIALAFIVDVIGTEVLGAALGNTYVQLAGGVSRGTLERFAEDVSTYDNPWGIANFIIGSGMSVLGGYLCVKLAWQREWRCVAWLCVVHVGYSFWRVWPVTIEWWESNAITLGSVLIGAALTRGGQRRAARLSSVRALANE